MTGNVVLLDHGLNRQILLTLIESQKRLISRFETFSDQIGDIEKTVSSLKSDSWFEFQS